MQPQMLWTLSEGLERSWDNQDVPNSEKSACWGDQFMVGINGLVPLSEPELSGRWKGALRFQGAADEGEFMAFWAVGWGREGAVILWGISEAAGTHFLLGALVQHRVFLCWSVATSCLFTCE